MKEAFHTSHGIRSDRKLTQNSNKGRRSDMNAVSHPYQSASAVAPSTAPDAFEMISFIEDICEELEGGIELVSPDAYLKMALHLLRGHHEARIITPTSLIGASEVPYATASRRLKEMVAAGLIEQRPRTNTGKSFSVHPSEKLLEQWARVSGRVRRLADARFAGQSTDPSTEDYYFGGSYSEAVSIPPPAVLPDPIKTPGGIRVLVHGDPTFMVMDQLKRQFEQVIGTHINQRAFSIDRLREEALRNAERSVSRYDIIAVDLPWVGEFAEAGVLTPLDKVMDVSRLDPADFHTAGWKATHWGGRAYAVPAQTTPELLFYRRDIFAAAGLEPPSTTEALLRSARMLRATHSGFAEGRGWVRHRSSGRTRVPGHDRYAENARGGRVPVGAAELLSAGHSLDELVRKDQTIRGRQRCDGLRLHIACPLFRAGRKVARLRTDGVSGASRGAGRQSGRACGRIRHGDPVKSAGRSRGSRG